MFIRPTIRRWGGCPSVTASFLARSEAPFRFDVMLSRLGRRTATHRQSRDDDFDTQFVSRDRKPVIDVYDPRRLHSLIVDVHQPSRDCGGRLRPRLEEASEPEPFVDAQRRS